MKKLMMVAAALLMLFATANADAEAETFTLKAAGEPEITATDLPNGMLFKGYEGKPLLLNFFGKNCPYCKEEIPNLVALKKQYGDKIAIIGIHVQERMTLVERSTLQKQLGINYPVYEYDDNTAFVRYIGSRARFNGSIPFNIFFNGKGEVEGILPGYVDDAQLKAIFADMLKP